MKSESEVAQSCLTLCNPTDSSPPGSTVHGTLQARILEWAAISFSRDLPDPGTEPGCPTLQADTLPCEPPGSQWTGTPCELTTLQFSYELYLREEMALVVKEIDSRKNTHKWNLLRSYTETEKGVLRGIFKVFKRHYDLLNFYCQWKGKPINTV